MILLSVFSGTTREFSIICLPQPETILSSTPSPTHNTTYYHQYTISTCEYNTLVTGLVTNDDGRFEVLCSPHYNNYSLTYCNWSRWLNEAGEDFFVSGLPWPWVIKSVLSHSVMRGR